MPPRARLAVLGAALLASAVLTAPALSAGPPPAPVLIERAVAAGTLDFSTGQLYTAYAMFAWEQLPQAYRSPTPFDGTLPLLRLRQNLDSVSGLARLQIAALVGTGPTDPGTSICELSPLPSTSTLETAHFYIEYNARGGGLEPRRARRRRLRALARDRVGHGDQSLRLGRSARGRQPPAAARQVPGEGRSTSAPSSTASSRTSAPAPAASATTRTRRGTTRTPTRPAWA